eukprot:TRINITY_DN63934_c0_g1_i1.p1 TRINITY_DN63934_c0_g1~~TRINITY_DN63934_c0_g1_i1.p1  ORF type:complete len:426 (+),score=71.78 TRINITY_DN63934_c0_g1_i1:35-1312(+)
MPKSYELKLREVEERRRPKPKEELYKAVEGQSQKIMVGFDHPESLQFELQLTWIEDMCTIDETHDYLMSEVKRIDGEYRRKPLRSNYTQKYIWFDRFVLRPRIQGRDLVLQDYGIEPGYRLKVSPFYQSEKIWGQPFPFDMSAERPKDQLDPCEDPELLVRLDKGPPGAVNRFFFFPWLGGNSSAYIPVVQKMPKDVACYALDMPGRGEREFAEGYPNGAFAIKVMAMTLAQEMRKSGNNYVFAHSQGTHFAYYVLKLLRSNFNVSVKAFFVSNFAVPASMPSLNLPTLRDRQEVCVPMKIFTRLIKGGWGCDPKLGFKNHMGWQAYQSQELWPVARSLIMDHWITKEFPLPGADQALQCPIVAFYGVEDTAVSEEAVLRWQALSSDPDKFKLIRMQGGHLWFQNSSARCEELANELASLMKKFR